MNTVDDVLDDGDLEIEDDSDLEFAATRSRIASPDARRRVEQLMELRRLRQQLGDPDFVDFE